MSLPVFATISQLAGIHHSRFPEIEIPTAAHPLLQGVDMQTSNLFEKRENILDAALSRAACKSQLLLASAFRKDLFQ